MHKFAFDSIAFDSNAFAFDSIGSVRCIIIPIDGDCALGFRCIEFTSCSMADEQFASLICSQLKIGLGHRGAKTSGRKCDLLQILYDD